MQGSPYCSKDTENCSQVAGEHLYASGSIFLTIRSQGVGEGGGLLSHLRMTLKRRRQGGEFCLLEGAEREFVIDDLLKGIWEVIRVGLG